MKSVIRLSTFVLAFCVLTAQTVLSGSFSGTVTESVGGTTLENIDVGVFRWSDEWGGWWGWIESAGTDTVGHYAVTGLAPGLYRVRFSDGSNQYVSEVYNGFPGIWPYEGGTDIQISEGDAFTGIDAALTLGSKITGRVTDASGTLPLEDVNATAYIWTGSWWQWRASAQTAADGTYEIQGLMAGTYRVQFYDWSGQYISQIYDHVAVNWVGADGTDIEVLQGATVADIDASLEEYATLSGVITETDGITPIAGVEVRVQGTWSWGTSDASGHYSITGIRPGTYALLALTHSAPGFLGQWYRDVLSTTPYWWGDPPEGVTLVSFSSGEAVSGANFALERAARIRGSIAGEGIPLPNARAKLRNLTYDLTYHADADATGAYAFEGLLPGAYRIKAEVYGFRDEWWESAGHEDFAAAVPVTFGDDLIFDFDLEPGQSPGFVEVTSTPAGAEIYLEHQPTGSVTPATLHLGQIMPVASHTVALTVKLTGYADPGVRWADAIEAETHTAHFDLEPLATAETGSILIATDPEVGAEVFVNFCDVPAGVTPVTVGNLMTDYHMLVLRKPGYLQTAPILVSVEAGETTAVTVPMHALDSDAPRVAVEIATTPPGADVYVDYLPSGQVTDVVVDWLDAASHAGTGWFSASHTILLRKPGYLPTTAYPVPGGPDTHLLHVALMQMDNLPPDQPVALLPANGATGVSLFPLLRATAFDDPNPVDTHAFSHWRIALEDNFSDLLWESGIVAPGEAQIEVPDGVLSQLTTYWWQVRYGDDLGAWSEWSVPVRFTTRRLPLADAPLPLAPMGEVLVRRPNFLWEALPEATWYQLIVTRANGAQVFSQWRQTTDWTPPSNMALGDYHWRVAGWNAVGLGPMSADTPFSIVANRPDVAPTILSPAQDEVVGDRLPVFEWLAVERATWYRIWVSRNGAAFLNHWVADVTTWTPEDAWPAGQYACWIAGWGPDGLGPWSTARDFTIPFRAPGEITQIAPTGAQTGNDLTFRWNKDVNATWYRLWVGRPGGGTWHNRWYEMSGTGEGTATVNGHPGGTSEWWMRPWGPDGYGPWAGPRSFSTPDPAPAVPTLVSPVGQTTSPVTLQYESERAEWYRVYVMRGGTVVLDRWTQDATFNLGARPSGNYTWWVAAWNAASGRIVWSGRGDFWIP